MMLRKLAATITAVALAMYSVTDFPAQSTTTATQDSRPTFNPSRLSHAVINAATSDLANIVSKSKAGTLNHEDVDAAISSSRILFAHFEEIGLNDALDAERQNLAQRLQQQGPFNPSSNDVVEFRERAAKHGASVFPTNPTFAIAVL